MRVVITPENKTWAVEVHSGTEIPRLWSKHLNETDAKDEAKRLRNLVEFVQRRTIEDVVVSALSSKEQHEKKTKSLRRRRRHR